MFVTSYLDALLQMAYPHLCRGCGAPLYNRAQWVCRSCIRELPRTGYENDPENTVTRMLAGRISVAKSAAWLHYSAGTLTQHLIHQVKYRGQIQLGEYLGWLMGRHFAACGWLQNIEVLVPLPLNRKKMVIRGYNQSTLICQGMRRACGLPVEEVAVMRRVYTQTQTKKSRLQRWANVAEVFAVKDAAPLEGRHALLIDDVVTTGATLEACGKVLLQIPGLKLSVLTLATASRL